MSSSNNRATKLASNPAASTAQTAAKPVTPAEPAKTAVETAKPFVAAVGPVAEACRKHKVGPVAAWNRFLTGSGPNDLATLMPGKKFTPDTVIGVWKSGGRGMNVKKLLGRLATAPVAA